MSLNHDDLQVRKRNALVPLRGYRLTMALFDTAYEVAVDFYAAVAVSEFKVWTTTTNRIRIKIGAGSYFAVGATQATALDLGAFTEGETKQGTVEVTVPTGSGSRHEELALKIDLGV